MVNAGGWTAMANPFIKGSTVATADIQRNLPLCKEYAWDFTRDNFIYGKDKQPKIVTGNKAIQIWVWKVLRVERYRFRAYFDDYGIELERFIGKVTNDSISHFDLFEYVKEALLVNPYIIEVEEVDFVQEHRQVVLHIGLQTIYGHTTIGVEV